MMAAENTRDDTREALGPIAHVLAKRKSRSLLDEVDRRAAQIVAKIQASGGFAEIVPGCVPQWHLALVLPGMERLAADELCDRGFGVCVPEEEREEIRRGRLVTKRELLLPGYVLFFGWDIDGQLERVRACEGVRDVLLRDGHAFIVPDWAVNVVRRIENTLRPLQGLATEASDRPDKKKGKRRWRNSLKPKEEAANHDNDIVGVHSYSPIIEEMRQEMLKESANDRISAFHRALGLPVPNQSKGSHRDAS